MHSALIIASELKHKSLWFPAILGVLVVVAAIVLFCGSIYLLLATNLGARLGFLVAAAGLSGFMIVLSLLWWTTSSPLNTFKGSIPTWKAVEVVSAPKDSGVTKVRDIKNAGNKVDTIEAANVKAIVDAALVRQTAEPGQELPAGANKYAAYDDPTAYLVKSTWEIGGRQNGWGHIWTRFSHPTQYAVAEFCTATKIDAASQGVPYGLPPGATNYDPATGKYDKVTAKCDGDSKYLVLRRSLGSLRVPPMVTFLISSILFALCLLALHWRERDEQERAAAEAGLTPAPSGA
ncbi:MAG: hypothetical protein U0V73_03370 [Acidimicrobiia bacterium]